MDWGDIDYLIVDTPPGTSAEHITVIERLKYVIHSVVKLTFVRIPVSARFSILVLNDYREFRCDGAVLVTTPQQISLEDVRKEFTLCKKTGIPVIGVIENMSGYTCPNCRVSLCTWLYHPLNCTTR